ncbi:glycosyltransferase, GG-Bacteroidales peptide system [Moraxella caprae]|uniref:Glycosyltransferase, GG-Bacteroidales peptide system n=1 Tax=Moraxella caprae TaxID=90240 RepID=A0A378R2E9_9GAMM|nr:glycosyltransferase family 4 protein [Moraxella caprae]STZ08827.1 glycosyltransferase, GG-Bacteroidales peptide system [Moraxella caprae]
MINNKILIFFPRALDINAGGPAGFLAHNLIDKPRDCFSLSNDLCSLQNSLQKNLYRIKRELDKILASQFNKEEYQARYIFKKIKADQYQYIYFHEDIDFYHVKDLIGANQTVIFQPHCPELHSAEFLSHNPNDSTKYELIKKAEKAVFERADVVVFPNVDCKPIYQELYTDRNKFYYILSGAKRNYNGQNLSKKTLPKDKINLMYIGRRNQVKGFDIVLESFRKAYKKNPKLHLILVGNGNKIEEEGITDIGFSKEPINWYYSVDYLVNANRQSYFDLSIIEALSTGVPIIMSDNFGHSYYQNKSSLITTFDVNQSDSLVEILSNLSQKRNYDNLANIELYENYLTDGHYHQRLVNFHHDLISQKI